MSSGDNLRVSIHDTADGVQAQIDDLTSGQSGSMTASPANGFAQFQYAPTGTSCNTIPYAFHPMYSTSSEQTRVIWAAHSYNVAFSDEIGHFENCNGAAVPATPLWRRQLGESDHLSGGQYRRLGSESERRATEMTTTASRLRKRCGMRSRAVRTRTPASTGSRTSPSGRMGTEACIRAPCSSAVRCSAATTTRATTASRSKPTCLASSPLLQPEDGCRLHADTDDGQGHSRCVLSLLQHPDGGGQPATGNSATACPATPTSSAGTASTDPCSARRTSCSAGAAPASSSSTTSGG